MSYRNWQMYRASLHSFRASGLDNASNILNALQIVILSAIEVIRNKQEMTVASLPLVMY